MLSTGFTFAMLDYNKPERLTDRDVTMISPEKFCCIDFIKITIFGLVPLWA